MRTEVLAVMKCRHWKPDRPAQSSPANPLFLRQSHSYPQGGSSRFQSRRYQEKRMPKRAGYLAPLQVLLPWQPHRQAVARACASPARGDRYENRANPFRLVTLSVARLALRQRYKPEPVADSHPVPRLALAHAGKPASYTTHG